MIVVGINTICKWCQIIATHGTYTCPIKEVDGEFFFKFKNIWYKVAEYATEQLNIYSDDNNIIRKIIK